MEQSAGQCGGYRYIPSRRPKSKTLRSIKKKSSKGGAKRRVKKTKRHTRKH
jgi:hypothetical protein